MTRYTFGEIAENIKDKRKPVKEDKDTYIGLEHLDHGSLYVTRWGSETELKGEKLCAKKGDVLFGRRNTYLKRVAIAPFDCLFSAHGLILRPNEKVITKEYFPFFLSSDYFMNEAIRISVGSLSPTVNWGDLKELEFNLPPLEEQKRLADILWAAEDLKQKYMIALKSCDNLIEARFIEIFGHPFENPKKWPQSTIGKECVVERGGSPRPIEKYITKEESGLNWIKIGDADSSRYITKTAEKITSDGLNKTRQVTAGDLLLSNSMTFGHPYILKIDGCIHDGWLVLKFDYNKFNPLFLQTYLSLPQTYRYFSKLAAGGTVKNLNKELVMSVPLIIPPLYLQKEFEEFIHSFDKQRDNLLNTLEIIKLLPRNLQDSSWNL